MNTIDYQEKQQRNHMNGFLKVVDPSFIKFYVQCKDRTMLSTEALYDLWCSVKYICNNDMHGDIIEMGVWQGGALELIAHALNEFKGNNKIIGFDTFEGHPKPDKTEVDIWGNNMQEKFQELTSSGEKWAFADYDNVNERLKYLYENVSLIKGVVDEKIETSGIDEIAILRLDMDWYEPTKIALNKFYPKIQKGGVLIIDDYGHHSGARQATDEYVIENKLKINFRHINYSCVVANIL